MAWKELWSSRLKTDSLDYVDYVCLFEAPIAETLPVIGVKHAAVTSDTLKGADDLVSEPEAIQIQQIPHKSILDQRAMIRFRGQRAWS